MHNISTYADIQQLLADERSLNDAAEAHGTLAGALCTTPGYRLEDWLLEILPEGRAKPESAMALRALFTSVQQGLAGDMLEFEPLLPDDTQPIDERTAALAQWCVGFLYGLGSGSLSDAGKLTGEAGEVVRDLTEITKAGVDRSDPEESNESAYAELVEFVRVGVQLVFDELGSMRTVPSKTNDAQFH